MKTSSELAESRLDGPAVHKRRATQLRRVAGGIRTELASAATTGLSTAEIKKLTEAASLLEELAGKYRAAEKLAKKRQDEFERIRKQVYSLMAPTFGALKGIEDRVALIAAVQSYQLRRSMIMDLGDLDFYAKDALDSLTHTLARQAETRAATEVVAEAWRKFEEGRGRLITEFMPCVDRLVAAAGRT